VVSILVFFAGLAAQDIVAASCAATRAAISAFFISSPLNVSEHGMHAPLDGCTLTILLKNHTHMTFLKDC
jgi:hypothetical protein